MNNAGKKYGGRVSLPISYMAVLARLLLYLYPFLLACNKEEQQEKDFPDKGLEEIHLDVKSPETAKLQYYDIFVFNDDLMGRLDAYTRLPYKGDYLVYTLSRNGNKKIAVVANSPEEKYSWAKVNSWKSLEESFLSLENEDPQFPVMTGSCKIQGSPYNHRKMDLHPMMAKIRLKSLTCDFSGTPLSGKRLEEGRCYLTNVCSRYPVLCDKIHSPTSYINQGHYRQEDMDRFRSESMLYHEFGKAIGSSSSILDLDFYCYPNIVERPGLAHPYTRMVIEGKIDGNTYYYPIDLKMPVLFSPEAEDGVAKGIDGGCEYELDIVLTRPGTLDPDTAISREVSIIKMTIRNWDEKDKQIIGY